MVATMATFVSMFPVLAALIIVVACAYLKTYPSMDSLERLANLLNSKGGNILMLAFMSLFFFLIGVRFLYWTVERIIEGKLTADNAVVSLGVSWITGAAFGGAFSSMLKSMTGEATTTPTTQLKEEKTSTVTNP